MNKWKAYANILLLLSVAISVIVNPTMPDIMAVRWNLQGQIDGYASRFWGLFLVPLIMIVFILLFSVFPKIDPLIKNPAEKKEMSAYFDKFIFMLALFLFYIHLILIFVNLNIVYKWGINLNVGQMILPPLGVLFFFLGIFLMNIRRNWFAGFRTPWTINSDEIWRKTHRVGGFLFIVTGALVAFSFLWVDIAVWILGASIAVDVLVPVAYSLYLYLQTK